MNSNENPDEFFFKNNGTFQRISQREIVYLNAEGRYTKIFVKGEERPVLLTKTLKDCESELNRQFFYRAHYGCTINLAFVEKINTKKHDAVLTTGETVKISRRRLKHLVEKWKNMYSKN